MDYDADGDLDILSGSYTGEVYLFERVESGHFRQGRFLTLADGSPLNCSTSITPEAVDMDGDGDLDLVIGSRTSGVFVITNLGTRQAPTWSAKPRKLTTVTGKAVKGSNAHHADWDGDGLRDLIVGSEWGEAAWYRNVGKNRLPRYSDRVTLIARQKYVEIAAGTTPTHPGSRTKVHVTDYNGDGRADLLVGDVQWHWKMLTPLTAEKKREKKAFRPRYKAAKEVYFKVVEERNSHVGRKGGIPKDVLERYRKASETFRPFRVQMASYDRRRSETHGFVWVYLRKQKAVATKPADNLKPSARVQPD